MKYCIVHLIGNTWGGVASMAKTLMQEQSSRGYKVIAVVTEPNVKFAEGLDKNIEIKYCRPNRFPGSNMLFGYMSFKDVDHIITKYVDYHVIVHAHNVASLGLINVKKRYNIVCTLHGKSIWKRECFRKKVSDYLNAKIISKIVKNGGKVIAVSKETSRYFSNRAKVDIPVIYNGTKKKCKNRIEFEKQFVIGHVGGVSYAKGWDIAVQSVGEFIKRTNADAMLASAGKIYIEKSEIECIVDQANMKNRYHNYGLVEDAGNTFTPNLKLLILPSISEGLPMSIIEALSYGVPVIASKVGGISEIIYDNINGFTVGRNAEEIVSKLIYIYSNPDIYREMSNNAMDIYEQSYTSKIMMDKYGKAYDDICLEDE